MDKDDIDPLKQPTWRDPARVVTPEGRGYGRFDQQTMEIGEARERDYGKIEDNCKFVREYVKLCTGEELEDETIILVLVALKFARRKHGAKPDHDIDIINYMRLLTRVTDYDT